MQIKRYFYTLRYLKWSQIYWRLRYKLIKVKPNLDAAPELRITESNWKQVTRKKISIIGINQFDFLNKSHDVCNALDWNNPKYDKLWLYNLHYFDDLNAINSQSRTASHMQLIDRWINENPPGYGNGWEAYPISLRICNWIKWSLSDNPMNNMWQQSLAIQARLLNRKIEWHILGNHLFTNAKALVFAGVFFNGDEAEKWLNTGLLIIDRELDEQILLDGGHFELSPMYHSIILEDILDLIHLYCIYEYEVPTKWQEKAEKMLRWLDIMTHPDGQIVLFNDSAFEIALSPGDLVKYGNSLRILSIRNSNKHISHLKETGYIKVEQDICSAYLDVAQIGPDYLPGHAHADSLNFELSIEKQRVFVDSGTSVYGVSEERGRQRSTRAHNTVCIDQEDSSEVWSGFRVARRAKVYDVNIVENNEQLLVGAKHDGYIRLKGKPIHERCWQFSDKTLRISDILSGQGSHEVEINWHIHPNLKVETSEQVVSICDDAGREVCRLEIDPLLTVSLCGSSYHPQFGMRIDNIKIECKYEGRFPITFMNTIHWNDALVR